jgi:RNA polymerase sigma-70 factor (ECF subfamily)
MKSLAEKQDLDISALVSEHGDDLYRFALMRIGQKELAEDLVQETFLTALTKIDTYRAEGPIQGWLRKILKNKIIDLIRSRSYKEAPKEAIEFFSDWGIWKEPIAKWSNWQESPEDSLERKKFFEIVSACLAKLPLKQRIIIGLKAFDGMSTQDICKELEITSSNEWVLTHRARLGLRECLEKNWYKKQ